MKGLALAVWTAIVCAVAPAAAEVSLFEPDLRRALGRLEAARGPEAYSALRELWRTWDRAEPIQVEAALRAASENPRLGAPAQAYAGLLSAYARLRRGDFRAARERVRNLGFVDRWLIVGPFDNEGKSGLATELGPEAAFSEPIVPGRAHSGKNGAVRWREVPDAFPYGYVDAGSLVRPDRKVCVFLTTFIRDTAAPARARDASIWVGSGGAFKLFWNGAPVLEDAAYRGHDADRFAAIVRVEPGPNNLTLKLCGDEQSPVASVRVADVRGAPDPLLRPSNDLAESAAAASLVGKARKAAPARGLLGPVQAFDALVEGTAGARENEAYARYLVETNGDDPTVHRARNLAQKAAESAPTFERMLLAARLAEDRNQRARWIERAERLAKPADRVELLLARAALLRESLNFQEAFPLYDRVLEIDPDNVEAIQGRVELYNGAGLRRTALSLLERATARRPQSVILLSMYASQLAILGRTTEAREVQSRYAGLRFDDRTFLTDMLELATRRKSTEPALRWVDRLLGAEPDSQWALGLAARTYRALGMTERAVAAYERALSLAPEDVGTLRSFADLRGKLGQKDEQLSLLQQILRLRPQDTEVRQYVEYVEPEGARPDEAHAWNPERFLRQRTLTAGGQNRRTLLDLKVSTVFENGLSSEFRQVVFQPLTDAAAAFARQYSFQYQADRQRVQLRGARVFRGDGRVDEAIESGEGAADDPSIAMYTSARTFYVQFPRLEPGDVVELRYRIDDVSPENQFADYFGDITYLQSNEPVLHAEYVLVTPKNRRFYFDQRAIPGLKSSTKLHGNQRVYRFWAEDLPALAAEPAMPPWPEVLGFVHVSTFKNWQDLGRWYWGLVRDQFDLDDDTRALARRIAGDEKSDADKVKAVYNWVVRNTRYVALEFGIYGYKPRRCVQTVTRGWGDCKDKATVLVTLLTELGVPTSFVVLRSGMRGDFQSSVASLAPFDHAIAYVPSLNLYLDGTAEYAGAGELPPMDLGALGSMVNKSETKLVRLPAGKPDRDVRTRAITATLSPGGRASVKVDYTVRGTQAPSWRRRFHAESTRQQRLLEDLGSEFPGFSLAPDAGSVVATGLSEFNEPVTLSATGTVERFARREGAQLALSVTPGLRLSPKYASLSHRRLPVAVPHLGTLEDTFVIKLPRGLRVVSAPTNVARETEFGSYSVQVETQGQSVTVTTRLSVKARRIAPNRYPHWQAFCAEADQAFAPRLVLGPG